MKKKFLIIYFIIMFLSVFIYSSFASTNFQNRTSDNLHVGKNITLTSSNRQAILKTPYVDASEKIYDFANLFSDSEEKELYNLATKFIDEKNMDIVIVTIDNNNKSSAMDYADDFYDYNDFGIGENYSGILLLIDMDTRNVWISTTGDAIKLYPDSYIDKILNKVQPNLSSKKYFNGAKSFINMAKEKQLSDPSSSTYSYKTEYSLIQRIYRIIVFSIVGFLISILGSTIFCAVQSSKHKPVKISKNANEYLDSSSFKVLNRDDTFVSTHTTRTRRPSDDDYHSSSSISSSNSGGSSTHSSSSGISHGGGRKKLLN